MQDEAFTFVNWLLGRAGRRGEDPLRTQAVRFLGKRAHRGVARSKQIWPPQKFLEATDDNKLRDSGIHLATKRVRFYEQLTKVS